MNRNQAKKPVQHADFYDQTYSKKQSPYSSNTDQPNTSSTSSKTQPPLLRTSKKQRLTEHQSLLRYSWDDAQMTESASEPVQNFFLWLSRSRHSCRHHGIYTDAIDINLDIHGSVVMMHSLSGSLGQAKMNSFERQVNNFERQVNRLSVK